MRYTNRVKHRVLNQGWPMLAVIVGAACIFLLAGGLFFYQARVSRPIADDEAWSMSLNTPVKPVRPTASSTQEERRAYVDAIAAAAVDASEIDITDCLIQPQIARAALGSIIYFSNSGGSDHFIAFNPSQTYVVGAHSAKLFDSSSWAAPGVRSYNCDDTIDAGTLYLLQP